MVHFIGYELKGYRSRHDYERLAEAIRGISGVWCHIAESKWLVETEMSTEAVCDRLAGFTLTGDPLLVMRVQRDWKAYSLTPEQIQWLNARNFGSLSDVLSALLPLKVNPFGALLPKPAAGLANAVLGLRT